MGWFDSITSGISKAVSTVGNVAVKALDTNAALFSHPITAVTKGIPAAISEFKSTPPMTNARNIVATTAVASAAVLTAGTSTGQAAALAAGKALVPKTATGIIATAVAAPVVATAVLSNPSGAAKTVGNVVSAQVDAGKLYLILL